MDLIPPSVLVTVLPPLPNNDHGSVGHVHSLLHIALNSAVVRDQARLHPQLLPEDVLERLFGRSGTMECLLYDDVNCVDNITSLSGIFGLVEYVHAHGHHAPTPPYTVMDRMTRRCITLAASMPAGDTSGGHYTRMARLIKLLVATAATTTLTWLLRVAMARFSMGDIEPPECLLGIDSYGKAMNIITAFETASRIVRNCTYIEYALTYLPYEHTLLASTYGALLSTHYGYQPMPPGVTGEHVERVIALSRHKLKEAGDDIR